MNHKTLLNELVHHKLNITDRIQYELDLINDGPDFIATNILKAYQHIILENNEPSNINEMDSLIAHELGITILPPGNTSFHYPISPGSFPDIDSDYADPKAVKTYIKNKYGEDYVVGIPTYGKYKFKGLLSDLCRVVLNEDGHRYVSLDYVKLFNKKLSHKIDYQISSDMTDIIDTDDAIDADEELFSNEAIQELQHEFPQIFEHFKTLYALPKYRGQHAAGVVILPTPARDTLPLAKISNNLCAEWTEGQGVAELSSVGIIKIDVLGLKTLKILDTCNNFIMSRFKINADTPSPCACKKQKIECVTNHVMPLLHRSGTNETLIDFNKICLNIPEIFKAIGDGNTQGVFQFEPDGITAFTKRYEPKKFYDLALITALYRPGPLDARLDEKGMPLDPKSEEYKNAPSAANMFIERHNGRAKVYYASTKLKDILKDSYGITVYQEQISLVIMAMTGGSFSDAEKTRKFLTKVNPETLQSNPEKLAELNAYEEKFIKAAIDNNCNRKEAKAVWNMIAPFARYGFVKAHAVAYSLISYQTAFCRTLFPLEYLTALMIHNIDNTDKLVDYIRTAQKLNFTVIPPNINTSNINFTITNDNKILGGLEMVKGVGEKAAYQIIQNRNAHGPFTSLEDFLSRDIVWRQVDRGVLEALTKAGVFDSISPNRALTWAKIMIAKNKAKITDYETKDLFTDAESTSDKALYVEEWPEKTKIEYEREVFGFLFENFITKNQDKALQYQTILNTITKQSKKNASIGNINEIKILEQKNGLKYARLFVTNIDGVKEQWILFANVWSVHEKSIYAHETYVVIGNKDEKGVFIGDSVQLLSNLI